MNAILAVASILCNEFYIQRNLQLEGTPFWSCRPPRQAAYSA